MGACCPERRRSRYKNSLTQQRRRSPVTECAEVMTNSPARHDIMQCSAYAKDRLVKTSRTNYVDISFCNLHVESAVLDLGNEEDWPAVRTKPIRDQFCCQVGVPVLMGQMHPPWPLRGGVGIQFDFIRGLRKFHVQLLLS